MKFKGDSHCRKSVSVEAALQDFDFREGLNMTWTV